MATAGELPGSDHDDSSAREKEQQRADPARAGHVDCSHLDEDPEALEDPVHRGDARHQHDLHEQAKRLGR